MRILTLAIALCCATGAAAQMTAAEFDAYTRGKTLYYGTGGAPYGAEIYLPGRRVRWTFLNGDCKDGHWYAEGPQICFVYEDRPDPQCWEFERGPDGLIARFESDPAQLPLYEVTESDSALECRGPRIGV